MDEVKEGSGDDRLESAIKSWLELGPGKKSAPKVGWYNPNKGK